MKRFIWLAAFLPVLAAAKAQPGCEWISLDPKKDSVASDRLRTLIKEKRFSAVEDELAGKLARYENGEFNDLVLNTEVQAAMKSDPSLEPLLAQWVAEKPRSFFANWLKGVHHVNVGWAKRGGAFSDKTSAEQLEGMTHEFGKAISSFNAARELKPHSALPHAGMLRLVGAQVGAAGVEKLAVESDKADPRNLAARNTALFFLGPKWGGSFGAIEQLVARAAKAPVGEPKLRHLRYTMEMVKADHFDVVTKEKTKAIEHWRKANSICSSEKALGEVSRAAIALEDWSLLHETTNNLLEVNPGAATVIQRRGWASEKMGHIERAITDYETAAALGEAWSQNRLGYFLMVGKSVPQDRPRARRLFESALAQGVKNAQQNLDWLNRQPGSNQ